MFGLPTAGSADPEFTAFHGHPLDEFIPLSLADVIRLVKDFPTKACGLDPVPTWLVKDFVQLLAPYLTNLFNRSLTEGYFSFLRCSAWLRLRRSSKSPHSIHQCSAATGPSRICRSSRRCWSGLLMSGCLNTYNRTDSCRKINPRTDVATQRKPLF